MNVLNVPMNGIYNISFQDKVVCLIRFGIKQKTLLEQGFMYSIYGEWFYIIPRSTFI